GEAASPYAAARTAAMSQPPPGQDKRRVLGGPAAAAPAGPARSGAPAAGPLPDGRNTVTEDKRAAGVPQARQHAPLAPDRPYGPESSNGNPGRVLRRHAV